jgi:hypothetical protein
MKVVLPRATRWLPTAALILCVACDESSSQKPAPAEAPPTAPLPPAPPPTASAPEPPRPPDIIVDRSTISIGRERVPMGEPGLANALVTLLSAQPGVAGQAVDVVAMRNAKPSQIEGVIAALETAKAASVGVKTETRDSATARLPISFATSVPDCVTVGWIAKDAAIEVWAAGGGKPKRVIRGLAGPDMTLGTEAMRAQAEGCSASQVAIGADDSMNWGLVFDLGTSALTAPGARASSVVLLPAAVPGKKLTL